MPSHHFPQPDRPDDATLARYLEGTCGPAELAGVERWLEADPANRAEFAKLQAAWSPPAVPEADPDDRMWQWISARMDAPVSAPVLMRDDEAEAPRTRPTYRYRVFPASPRRWGVLAAAVLLAVVGTWLWRLPPSS